LRSRLYSESPISHYRAYLIGLDGHFIKSVDLSYENDDAAIEKAKQLVDGHDVELWQQARKVAVFKRHPE
jgi:hypothetical protein